MSQDDDPLAGLDDALAALGGDTGYRMRTEAETLTGLDSALNSLHDRSYTAVRGALSVAAFCHGSDSSAQCVV